MLFLLGNFGSLDKSQYPSSKGIRSLRHAQPTQAIGGSRLSDQLPCSRQAQMCRQIRWGGATCETGGMALRSPIYLDTETLLSLAEYHDIDVPHQADIVEKTTRKRSGGGKVGMSGFGADVAAGSDVEYQSTYALAPREKATTSKVIDELLRIDAVTCPSAKTALTKDLPVEVEGRTRITAASLAGKVFYIFQSLMAEIDGDVEDIFNLEADQLPIAEPLKEVYLQNKLLPIPILLELTGSALPLRVYVNVRPDHFIDAASADSVEGEMRVLGTVSSLIGGDSEGYLSAEQWLLHGWEYMMKRKLMAGVDEIVKGLVEKLELDLPVDDVHAYITGPAIVVDAIALY